jgi:hypothetical protein
MEEEEGIFLVSFSSFEERALELELELEQDMTIINQSIHE